MKCKDSKKAKPKEALDAGTRYAQARAREDVTFCPNTVTALQCPAIQHRSAVRSHERLQLRFASCRVELSKMCVHGVHGLQAETLSKEAAELEAAIAAEVQLRAGSQNGGAAAAGDEAAGSRAAAADGADAASDQPSANGSAAAPPEPEAADALDAFMNDMVKQAEAEMVSDSVSPLASILVLCFLFALGGGVCSLEDFNHRAGSRQGLHSWQCVELQLFTVRIVM